MAELDFFERVGTRPAKGRGKRSYGIYKCLVDGCDRDAENPIVGEGAAVMHRRFAHGGGQSAADTEADANGEGASAPSSSGHGTAINWPDAWDVTPTIITKPDDDGDEVGSEDLEGGAAPPDPSLEDEELPDDDLVGQEPDFDPDILTHVVFGFADRRFQAWGAEPVSDAEYEHLCVAFRPLWDKYLPDGAMAPEVGAVLVTLAVFGPRVRVARANRRAGYEPSGEEEPDEDAGEYAGTAKRARATAGHPFVDVPKPGGGDVDVEDLRRRLKRRT